jgi:hypothetical protein
VNNALAALAVASKKPWKNFQDQGGLETTKTYDNYNHNYNYSNNFDTSLTTLASRGITINLFEALHGTWRNTVGNTSGQALSTPAACVGSGNNSNSNLNDVKFGC